MSSKTFKVIAYAFYVFSAIATFIFFWSNAITPADKFMAVFYTAIFEPAKALFFLLAFFSLKKNMRFISFMAISVWLIFEIASVSASTSYMMNKETAIQQHDKVTKPEYLRLQEQIKNKQDQLNIALSNANKIVETDSLTNDNNAKLIAQYNEDIKAWQKQLNAKRQEYRDIINKEAVKKQEMPQMKKQVDGDIKDLQQRITDAEKSRDTLSNINNVATNQTYIDNLNAEISTLTIELNNISTGKSTSGNVGYFSQIASTLSWMVGLFGVTAVFTADSISFAFNFVLFGIAPEIAANIAYIVYKSGINIDIKEIFDFSSIFNTKIEKQADEKKNIREHLSKPSFPTEKQVVKFPKSNETTSVEHNKKVSTNKIGFKTDTNDLFKNVCTMASHKKIDDLLQKNNDTNVQSQIVCTMAPHKEIDSTQEESLSPQSIERDIVVNNTVEYKLTDALTKDYVKFVLDSDKYKKDGTSPGITKIADGLGVEVETARSVKRTLERAGFLEVVGKNTIVHSKKFNNDITL